MKSKLENLWDFLKYAARDQIRDFKALDRKLLKITITFITLVFWAYVHYKFLPNVF